jgi:thiol-disulfide isomerase/thioredoxin
VVGGVVVVVVVALVVALASAGGGGSGKKPSTTAPTYLSYGTGQVTGSALPRFNSDSPAKGDGLPLPTIRGQSPKGESITTTPTAGKQVVIVAAPWCPHCNRELPQLLNALQSGALGQPKITLVVSGQDPNSDNWPPGNWVYNTIQWQASTAPVLLDDKSGTAATALGLPAYPYFVFVDSQGRVGSRATGEISVDTFRTHLQGLR